MGEGEKEKGGMLCWSVMGIGRCARGEDRRERLTSRIPHSAQQPSTPLLSLIFLFRLIRRRDVLLLLLFFLLVAGHDSLDLYERITLVVVDVSLYFKQQVPKNRMFEVKV